MQSTLPRTKQHSSRDGYNINSHNWAVTRRFVLSFVVHLDVDDKSTADTYQIHTVSTDLKKTTKNRVGGERAQSMVGGRGYVVFWMIKIGFLLLSLFLIPATRQYQRDQRLGCFAVP